MFNSIQNYLLKNDIFRLLTFVISELLTENNYQIISQFFQFTLVKIFNFALYKIQIFIVVNISKLVI